MREGRGGEEREGGREEGGKGGREGREGRGGKGKGVREGGEGRGGGRVKRWRAGEENRGMEVI